MVPVEWAQERVRQSPGSEIEAAVARRDYLSWHSFRLGEKRATVAEVNKAIGGRRGFAPGRVLVFRDVALAQTPLGVVKPLSGAPGAAVGASAVEDALRALHAEGLVVGSRTLDVAYLRLTDTSDSRLCRRCGIITRHMDGFHVRCRRRQR